MPTHSKVWSWNLLIVIVYAGMIGNCLRFNTKGRLTSIGAKSILGIKTISPLLQYDPFYAVIKLFCIDLIIKCVPLHSPFYGLRLLSYNFYELLLLFIWNVNFSLSTQHFQTFLVSEHTYDTIMKMSHTYIPRLLYIV
jgi:hypothetical protein